LSGLQPAPGEVWVEDANQLGGEAPAVFKAECEEVGYSKVTQWTGARVSPLNAMSTTAIEIFGPLIAEQGLLSTGGCPTSAFTSCFYENAPVTFTGEATVTPSQPFEIRSDEPEKTPQEVATGGATEVGSHAAKVSGFVVPDGEEVVECNFEYGYSEEGPFESTPCSPAPGSGHNRVEVSAQLSGLTPNSNVYYRAMARADKTVRGSFKTLTTLNTSASAETTEPSKPVKVSDGAVTVEASGGTGGITVGHYGSNIGGPALALGKGPYFQVYHSAGATFTKLEYSDCELAGAKTLWWDDPSTGWEPITEPTAVYDEATKCVKVTATANTRPSLAQLSDPRHVGGPPATEEYGKCVLVKHAHFEDAACTKEAKFKESGGLRSYKGKYEWLPAPVGCYALKHGRYAEGGCKTPKEKKGKPNGKFEAGQNIFTATGGMASIEATGRAGLECHGSKTNETLRTPNELLVQMTLTDCSSGGENCGNQGEGVIVSEPLESYTYHEESEYFTVIAGSPIMSFSCGHVSLALSGAAAGHLITLTNIALSAGEAAFGTGLGEQALELEEAQGRTYPATLTTSLQISSPQPLELRAKP
jgi:hypothetical protein